MAYNKYLKEKKEKDKDKRKKIQISKPNHTIDYLFNDYFTKHCALEH